jgi:hypothetical protein
MTSIISDTRRALARFLACVPIVLASAALLLAPPVALAQSQPQFDSLQVALWPEFDRKAMLVIYHANLPATSALPADISLSLPDGVAQPYAVAQSGVDGNLVDLNYTTKQVDGRTQVDLQATSQLVWIEFYQDITIDGSQRSYTFKWPGGLSVASLTAQIQVPPGISNLNLTPPASGQVIGQYGLTYQNVDLGPVSPSDRPTLTLTYTKPTDSLTADSLPQPTALSQPQATAGAAPEPTQLLLWGALGLGVVTLVVVLFLYLRVWRSPPRPAQFHLRRSHKSAVGSTPRPEASIGRVYCHQCGELAEDTDLFCRFCGTKLRR